MKVDFNCHTSGAGLWSNHETAVRIREIYLNHVGDEGDNGELHAVFDLRTWNVERYGLIYTDPVWERCLRDELRQLGFSQAAVESVSYSEQGMQGDNYVSLDVGRAFLSRSKPMATLFNEYHEPAPA